MNIPPTAQLVLKKIARVSSIISFSNIVNFYLLTVYSIVANIAASFK